MPRRKEQFQREFKRSAKNCIGLGDHFSKYTKKTAEPQKEVELLKEKGDEEVELLEENEDSSTAPRQSSLPKISGNVQDMRGYTENEYNELDTEDEEGINKGESIMDMLNDYSLISKPILPANACRINAKSLLPNQPLNFSYPTRIFNNRKRSFKASWYKKWWWFYYTKENDTVLCYVCIHANCHQMLLSNKNKEDAFITSGFSNWKNATETEKGYIQHSTCCFTVFKNSK